MTQHQEERPDASPSQRVCQRRSFIRMYGKGLVLDNIFVEWLRRTVTYHEIYLGDYEAVDEV